MMTYFNVSNATNLYIDLSSISSYQFYNDGTQNVCYITLKDSTNWNFYGNDADTVKALLIANAILPPTA